MKPPRREDKRGGGLTNERGSPLYIVNINDGSDVWLEAEYSAWGEVTSFVLDGVEQVDTNGDVDVSAWPVPFGFAGGLFDSATGLVRFGARDYDPTIGRWTSKDPILFDGGQTNLYVYVGNDPVQFVDPDGQIASVAIGVGVGALAGAGAAFFLGGDTQAVIAGAIGGAFAGGIAGAGLGLGPLGAIVQEGLASGLGGLVGDFANLRPGQKGVSLAEVGRLFAVRSLFGAAGGAFLSGLGPLSAPGWAGFVSSRTSEVIVGGACGIQGEFLAN